MLIQVLEEHTISVLDQANIPSIEAPTALDQLRWLKRHLMLISALHTMSVGPMALPVNSVAGDLAIMEIVTSEVFVQVQKDTHYLSKASAHISHRYGSCGIVGLHQEDDEAEEDEEEDEDRLHSAGREGLPTGIPRSSRTTRFCSCLRGRSGVAPHSCQHLDVGELADDWWPPTHAPLLSPIPRKLLLQKVTTTRHGRKSLCKITARRRFPSTSASNAGRAGGCAMLQSLNAYEELAVALVGPESHLVTTRNVAEPTLESRQQVLMESTDTSTDQSGHSQEEEPEEEPVQTPAASVREQEEEEEEEQEIFFVGAGETTCGHLF
uniref:uncharacterized protein n=1 Tax=Pristiophorus japonicus TaxID=55135 RepID=UPI00398F8916